MGTSAESWTGAARAMGEWIGQGARLGASLLGSLYPSLPGLGPARSGCGMRQHGCCCEIPTPCWLPERLPRVRSTACPGASAALLVEITNCGPTDRTFKIEADGNTPGLKVEPGSLSLGPMETGRASVTLAIPAAAAIGEERDVLVWGRGCRDRVIPWTVTVARYGESCAHVELEDGPDLLHHWYDHFYCERPCPHGR